MPLVYQQRAGHVSKHQEPVASGPDMGLFQGPLELRERCSWGEMDLVTGCRHEAVPISCLLSSFQTEVLRRA